MIQLPNIFWLDTLLLREKQIDIGQKLLVFLFVFDDLARTFLKAGTYNWK